MEEGAVLNNRYQLLERIGTGGMADVFRARDLMLERTVAIKILHEHYSAEKGFQERFKQEARAAANLSHPNIVTVHDFGFDHDQLYIVMEHIPGKDLKTVLRQRGRYPVDEAIPLIVQACAGIGYAHRAGLVHCDVKPHNMIVTPDGRLKVTDFGIARALSTIQPDERADVVWGSPQYFSPEQAAGEAPSPASDVYSLGIVLYEMITGALPFNAPTSQELARLHLEHHPIPPREYVPDIPPALEENHPQSPLQGTLRPLPHCRPTRARPSALRHPARDAPRPGAQPDAGGCFHLQRTGLPAPARSRQFKTRHQPARNRTPRSVHPRN
ncbi:MAG: serine/threonine protein kinase [Chloroflexota bacterium]|jgi:serine/threonine-protein kinase